MYYIKDRYLRRHNINSASDVPFACLKRSPSLQATIRSMAFVQGERERMLLLTVGPTDSPTYELYVFPAQSRGGETLDNIDPIRGSGVAAAFVARNKIAILGRDKQITIRTIESGRDSGTPKSIAPPHPNCDFIFPANLGHLLCKCDDRIVLFDCAQRLAVSDVIAPATKYAPHPQPTLSSVHHVPTPHRYVSWSSDGRHVALMSAHAIIICTKKLEVLASLTEARVKSGTHTLPLESLRVLRIKCTSCRHLGRRRRIHLHHSESRQVRLKLFMYLEPIFCVCFIVCQVRADIRRHWNPAQHRRHALRGCCSWGQASYTGSRRFRSQYAVGPH